MTEQAVTDEQLDAAAVAIDVEAAAAEESEEQATETEVETQETETEEETSVEEEELDEELPPEPTDHGERSQLGRRVSEIDRKFDERFNTLLDKLESLTAKPAAQAEHTVEYTYDPDEEIPMTRGELERLLEEREQKKSLMAQQDMSRYESGYRDTFAELTKNIDPEEAQAIEDEMMANYNIRYSDDPVLDAERNFLKAENAVLRNRPALTQKAPVKGKKPIGGASSTASASRASASVKLDPEAQALVADMQKKYGWKEEDVAKALEGDMPLNLIQGNMNAR